MSDAGLGSGDDPLDERLPRVVAYNLNANGIIDETRLKLHLCSSIGGYTPEEVEAALAECVDRETVDRLDGGYTVPEKDSDQY